MTGEAVEVSVVVVSYNTRRLIGPCLDSVAAAAAGLRHEVVVVDNASSDGSAEFVAEAYPDANLLVNEANLGFGAAVNRAVDEARGRFVLLVNSDAELHPGSIRAVVEHAEAHPEHGLYGGRVYDADGRVDPRSCWGLPTSWSVFCFGTGLSTLFRGSRVFDPVSLGAWARDTVREVGVVSGCFLLARVATWRELGGFDERFFMYSEDVDLGMRARRAGLRPVIVPAATLTHHVGASSDASGGRVGMILTGKATLYRKHWRGPKRAWGLAWLVAGVGIRAAGCQLMARLGRTGGDAWPAAWRNRRSWLGGYRSRSAGACAPDRTAIDQRE